MDWAQGVEASSAALLLDGTDADARRRDAHEPGDHRRAHTAGAALARRVGERATSKEVAFELLVSRAPLVHICATSSASWASRHAGNSAARNCISPRLSRTRSPRGTAQQTTKGLQMQAFDGRYWARTSDLLLVEQALSQLS
jgi:hypothetical protein